MEKVMKDSPHTVLQMIFSFKFGKDMVKRILTTTRKWDDIMLDRGKVNIIRLQMAWCFPELRERVLRYTKGKTKYIYKTVIIQLDKPSNITMVHMKTNFGTFDCKWTTMDNRNSDRVHGCSIKTTHQTDKLYMKDINIKQIKNAIHALCIIKPELAQTTITKDVYHTMYCLSKYGTTSSLWGIKYKTMWGVKNYILDPTIMFQSCSLLPHAIVN
jgi:hypothetical protein